MIGLFGDMREKRGANAPSKRPELPAYARLSRNHFSGATWLPILTGRRVVKRGGQRRARDHRTQFGRPRRCGSHPTMGVALAKPRPVQACVRPTGHGAGQRDLADGTGLPPEAFPTSFAFSVYEARIGEISAFFVFENFSSGLVKLAPLGCNSFSLALRLRPPMIRPSDVIELPSGP